jgi:hypothetical protein
MQKWGREGALSLCKAAAVAQQIVSRVVGLLHIETEVTGRKTNCLHEISPSQKLEEVDKDYKVSGKAN